MPKRLANGLTLLSAVVCVLSAMLVGRSVFRMDSVFLPLGRERGGSIHVMDGRLFVARFPHGADYDYESRTTAEVRPTLNWVWASRPGIPWLGIGWHGPDTYGYRYLVLPLWLLPLLTAIPPVRWWRARRREGGRGFAVEGAA